MSVPQSRSKSSFKSTFNHHSLQSLRVNRSTYYKWLHRSPSVRELENRSVRAAILELYAKTDKRLGTRKIKDCLNRDYCINISCGRVYRLMKTMNLPKMSTVKPPKTPQIKTDDSNCINLIAKNFNQPAPNMVWVCDFTYIRAVNRFYYLCAVLDLFAVNFITVFLLTLTVFTILSDLILTITVFLLTKRRRCLCPFDFFAVYFIDISPHPFIFPPFNLFENLKND